MTVLRPSKIHGEGAAPPREWIFVKRVLDRRPPSSSRTAGRDVDHPTAAVNIAALIETVAAQPGARILNSADPDAPSGLEIARTVARAARSRLGGGPCRRRRARDGIPWDKLPPVHARHDGGSELGYVPVGDYAATVADEIDWLVAGGHEPEPEFFARLFDYAAEDRFFAGARR